ncbi:hypothetical protein HYS93_04810 [Candidatus Daviesbacteria bacterium]|nr:hypothetical protein [Candidatus Daviesbacteria bacterium]
MINLNLKNKKILLSVTILLLLVVLILVAVLAISTNFAGIKDYSQGVINRLIKKDNSFAKVYLESNKLKIDFVFSQNGRQKAIAFSQKLALGDDWVDGLSFELDGQTVTSLKDYLPTQLVLNFSGQDLTFSSQNRSLNLLKNSLTKKQYYFATHSAQIAFETASDQDFSLEMTNPKQLLDYATSSSQLNLSKKAELLFPLSDRIAKILLKASGKNLSGQITLKN